MAFDTAGTIGNVGIAGRHRQLRGTDRAVFAELLETWNFIPGDQIRVIADPIGANNGTWELRALPSDEAGNWAKIGTGSGGGGGITEVDTESVTLTDQIAPITASDLQDFLTQLVAMLPLLVGGKLPIEVIPDELVTGLGYKGLWDADTNTPTITSGDGAAGDFYIVRTAGTTSIDGTASWATDDFVIFNGTAWEKLTPSNPQIVSEVFGLTGSIHLADLTASTITDASLLVFSKAGVEYKITVADFKTAFGAVLLSVANSDIQNIGSANVVGNGTTAAPANHVHRFAPADFTAKTAPVDADLAVIGDSADGNGVKKSTLLQLFTGRTVTLPKLDGYLEKCGTRVDATGAVAVPAPLTAGRNLFSYRLTGTAAFTLPLISGTVATAGYVATIVLWLRQDATGGRTVTFSAQAGNTIAYAGGTLQQPAATAHALTQYVFSIEHGQTEWVCSRIAFA